MKPGEWFVTMWATSPLAMVLAGAAVHFVPVELALLLGLLGNVVAAMALRSAFRPHSRTQARTWRE